MNTNPPNLDGIENLRLISEGERTRTWLVRGVDVLLVLKGELPGIGVDGGTLLARYERLKELSPGPGLLPILGCGVAEDGWVWHLVPLGDNLPGMPGLETAAGIEQYTPMTLRMRTQESGPAGARQVAEWGQRLCGGLELLHRSGLLHRGIQPSNVVFLQGEPRLGDYSRVGEAGSRVQMEGMEGFEPVLGGNSEEGDLHALGRTLYEAWTGRDRMEFPSLSRRVLESSEWAECGLGLNDAILKSDRGRENGGFRSAGEFGKALLDAGIGRRKVNRRAWLRSAVLAGLGVGAGFAILRGLRPVPRLHWELVGEDGFNVGGGGGGGVGGGGGGRGGGGGGGAVDGGLGESQDPFSGSEQFNEQCGYIGCGHTQGGNHPDRQQERGCPDPGLAPGEKESAGGHAVRGCV